MLIVVMEGQRIGTLAESIVFGLHDGQTLPNNASRPLTK